MLVKWNVETGFVNRMPDRECDIPDDELEECETEEEREKLIESYIQQEFENQISWYRTDK
jgi:hypothetical protein